eukprot:22260_1
MPKIKQEKQSDEGKQEETISNSDRKYRSEYGKKLFHHFCANQNRKKVELTKIELLPGKLYRAMFNDVSRQESISFISITKLFPFLTEIRFNNVNIETLEENAECYAECAIQFISHVQNTVKLDIIVFHSVQANDKFNITLENVQTE